LAKWKREILYWFSNMLFDLDRGLDHFIGQQLLIGNTSQIEMRTSMSTNFDA